MAIKVNMINTRREFFHVTLEEIEEAVKKNFDRTVEFTKTPNAEQYRESQMMRRRLGMGELVRQDAAIDGIQISATTTSPTPAATPAKTVRNYHGFISAVIGTFKPDMKFHTTLPQKIKSEAYIPSDDDVKHILAYAKNTAYEIPIALACYGLRRSEICALTVDDIVDDTVSINKAMVLDKDKNWVIKTTKTTASTRTIVIPSYIADLIREQGYVYKGHPNSITDYLSSTQKKLGIPHFSIHKLRHYFASKMSTLNIPEENILQMGGWETDHVMKNVYRHAMADKNNEAQREAAGKLSNVLYLKFVMTNFMTKNFITQTSHIDFSYAP